MGCYHRTYSEDHIASHPKQVVSALSVAFGIDEYDQYGASVWVNTTNGGHVKDTDLALRTFEQGLLCYDEGGRVMCAVECDGGFFEVTRDTGDSIDLTLTYLWVGDTEGCGGAVDIAEVSGEPVVYRLYKSQPEACVVN
ncbi:MAG: hypothetical protein VX874_18765 [Pseudomonadota bacterium]|nr:hypothetical protein [Pseudomonadota bacterium]